MLDLLHNKLKYVERDLDRQMQAPTFPIFDSAFNFPSDTVDAQICVGNDQTLFYKIVDSWYQIFGGYSLTGNMPQDVLNGQLAIGADNSLNWYFDGAWQSVQGVAMSGGPQDVVEGQIALNDDRPIWFSNGQWWAPADPGSLVTPLTTPTVYPLIAYKFYVDIMIDSEVAVWTYMYVYEKDSTFTYPPDIWLGYNFLPDGISDICGVDIFGFATADSPSLIHYFSPDITINGSSEPMSGADVIVPTWSFLADKTYNTTHHLNELLGWRFTNSSIAVAWQGHAGAIGTPNIYLDDGRPTGATDPSSLSASFTSATDSALDHWQAVSVSYYYFYVRDDDHAGPNFTLEINDGLWHDIQVDAHYVGVSTVQQPDPFDLDTIKW